MLAGLLMGALGMGLLDRFPGTRTDRSTTAQAKSQASQAQRLNADSLSWVPPMAAGSGVVLLGSECREMRDDLMVPRARIAAVDSDRAPPISPRCASAPRHT